MSSSFSKFHKFILIKKYLYLIKVYARFVVLEHHMEKYKQLTPNITFNPFKINSSINLGTTTTAT